MEPMNAKIAITRITSEYASVFWMSMIMPMNPMRLIPIVSKAATRSESVGPITTLINKTEIDIAIKTRQMLAIV